MRFDPYDPAIVDDPYRVYAALRHESPVYHGVTHDFWALTRFEDVKRALSEHETYCSSQGLLVLRGNDDYEAPEFPPGNMLLMDPPEHTAYRKVVNRKFLQRTVTEMEAQVREVANTLVDRFAEFVGFAIATLIAGNDTTSNLLANAMWLLAVHPDQRALLLDDPGLIPNAVEEILRFEPPVHGLARTLTRDVDIDGHTMERGKKVLLLFASANRDEREFADPERFDVRRRFEGHLSFGFGIHHCIGIHLGRLEGRIGIETLLARLGEYELATDAVHWRQLVPTRPMSALPITFPRRFAHR